MTKGFWRPSLMPNVKGEPVRVARRSISSRGCSVSSIRPAASTTVRKGRVISQTPKPGTRLTLGPKIGVVVSAGAP